MVKYSEYIIYAVFYLIIIFMARQLFITYFRGKQCTGRKIGYYPTNIRSPKRGYLWWNYVVLIEDEDKNIASESFTGVTLPEGRRPNLPHEEEIEYITVIYDKKSGRCLIGSKIYLAIKFLVIALIVLFLNWILISIT